MIMEAIYDGNFCPAENVNPKSPQYDQDWKLVDNLMELLSSHLNQEDLELVKEIMDHSGRANCIECESYFKLGFAAGIQLEKEVKAQLAFLLDD